MFELFFPGLAWVGDRLGLGLVTAGFGLDWLGWFGAG